MQLAITHGLSFFGLSRQLELSTKCQLAPRIRDDFPKSQEAREQAKGQDALQSVR